MKLRTFQIMLVFVAVLCAVGIIAGLGGSGDGIDANDFPPAWLKAMGGLAGGPRLATRDLTANGIPWRQPLALTAGMSRKFTVSTADDKVRRGGFVLEGRRPDRLEIRYQPKSVQRLNGEKVKVQSWPNEEKGSPKFVVYDGGGTFWFFNAGPGTIKIRLED
ncbi:hypothetical protein Pcar_2886 [Syntrophotalea carbinolica DSM 2380]|uniref:Uncharacterized protein n=1 Tax=Syntrophotalea carbinolica (strain DSM 2380 / NBRC 103641 / GraBd1) TaxID=338963 RepID=Q3A0I6_SYNC1|nr:hypothetical protein [Syntrophotalea carbinolica]ABA90121.1 hypothetical protein Pcar_2886 [Syntrophotalea carbinolica DSM 2380]